MGRPKKGALRPSPPEPKIDRRKRLPSENGFPKTRAFNLSEEDYTHLYAVAVREALTGRYGHLHPPSRTEALRWLIGQDRDQHKPKKMPLDKN